MYCVRCGVKLPDGAKCCPLCKTPVYYSECETEIIQSGYPDRYPEERRHAGFVILGLITSIMVAAALICFIVCIKSYGKISWSGHVVLGLLLGWIILIFPFWFRKKSIFVFIPVDVAAVCGFLLYICEYSSGQWFLSFAFPVTLISGAFLLLTCLLLRFVRRRRLFVAGGLTVGIGACCMLIEFFEHITFGTRMFVWSLYCVSIFTAIGVFLIIAAMIPSLSSYLERRFFI